MNKIFPIMLISFVLASTGVLALEPCPLAMKFVTSPPSANAGLNLQVNFGTLSATAVTNEFGEAMVDMGHLNIGDCLVQDFEVIVTECADDPICHQTVSFNPNGYTTIDIKDADLFEPPEECFTRDQCQAFCTTCSECVCNCQSCCPFCETPEEQGYILPADCPVQDNSINYLITGIVTLIAGLGIGKYGLGVKIYTNTKGEVVKQHKHKNVVGYHDPKIIHRSQPHKKGELTPKYSDEKDAEGKYKYVGG